MGKYRQQWEKPEDHAHHRFHHRYGFRAQDSGSHQRNGAATDNRPGAGAAAVGGRNGFGTGVQRPSMGYVGATCTGVRVRSAHCLAVLLALIQAIYAEFKGIYGSPRMVRELRGRGFPASRPRVERLMQENGIRARHKRRYKVTTDSMSSLCLPAIERRVRG